MQAAFAIDWTSVFKPSIGLAEVVVRGSIMYLSLFIILRFLARRQSGRVGTADLLVIVLIADAAQNALGKDYQSVTEGIVLVLTIFAVIVVHELGHALVARKFGIGTRDDRLIKEDGVWVFKQLLVNAWRSLEDVPWKGELTMKGRPAMTPPKHSLDDKE